MPRWLTMAEVQAELRVGKKTIYSLLKSGLLVGINAGEHSIGWRILDPSEKLRERLVEPELERFPLFTANEVAEVLGLATSTINGHVWKKKLRPHPGYSRNGSTMLFTPKEIRRFLAYREERRGPGSRSYSRTLVRWLKAYLEENSKSVAKELDEVIAEAVPLPEPERSKYISLLWEQFDRIEDILKEVQKIKAR
jgi:Helix-turn-helix domain